MYLWDIVLKEECLTYKHIKENIKEGRENPDLIHVYRDQLISEINKRIREYEEIQKASDHATTNKDGKQKELFEKLIRCRVSYECATLCLQYMNGTLNDDTFDIEMRKVYNESMKKNYMKAFEKIERDEL